MPITSSNHISTHPKTHYSRFTYMFQFKFITVCILSFVYLLHLVAHPCKVSFLILTNPDFMSTSILYVNAKISHQFYLINTNYSKNKCVYLQNRSMWTVSSIRMVCLKTNRWVTPTGREGPQEASRLQDPSPTQQRTENLILWSQHRIQSSAKVLGSRLDKNKQSLKHAQILETTEQ